METLWPKKPDYQTHYSTWLKAPTPENASNLLTQLEPVFGTAISRYAGGSDNPLTRSRARRMALDAIHSYDPKKGTKLDTHVMNHLKGLRRVVRNQQQVLRVPERASMDQAYLQRMEAELAEKLGREPSTLELADHASFSPRKIARLRKYTPAAPESAFSEDISISPVSFDPGARRNHIVEIIHSELGPTDQKILEWELGLHGAPKLNNQMIANRLRVSPGAISQRKATIQQKLDAMMQLGI